MTIQDLIEKYELENKGILKRRPDLVINGDFSPDGVNLFCNQRFIENLKSLNTGNSKRQTLDNFSGLLNKVIKKTKAADTGLIYCDADDIMQDVSDNYIIIKKEPSNQ